MTLRNLPANRPSVTFNFKRSKKLDPRVTFTRASFAESGTPIPPESGTGTVGGEIMTFNVDVPRLTDQGLLIEESRTNLVTNSQTFVATGYTITNLTPTDNAAVAPDGTMTAASMFETAVNDGHFIHPTVASQTTVSSSAFVKPIGRDNVCLRLFVTTGNWHTITFNLTGEGSVTQSIASGGSTWTVNSTSVTALPNGWYRIAASGTTTTGSIYPIIINGCTSSTPTLNGTFGSEFYLGDVTKGYYVWGLQVEAGTFPTSYIPTAGAEVTRAVDLVTLSNNNFTDWYNNSEGTWMLNVNVLGSSDDYPRLLQTNQSHNFEYQTLNSAPTAKSLAFQQWLTGQSTKTPYGIAPLGEFKTAAGYSIGNLSPIYIDGTEQVRGTFYSPGTAIGTPPTELRIFRQSNGGQYLSGYLKSLVYYPTNFNNDALEALTK